MTCKNVKMEDHIPLAEERAPHDVRPKPYSPAVPRPLVGVSRRDRLHYSKFLLSITFFFRVSNIYCIQFSLPQFKSLSVCVKSFVIPWMPKDTSYLWSCPMGTRIFKKKTQIKQNWRNSAKN